MTVTILFVSELFGCAQIKSFLQPPMQGVVLQTYGAGNVPDTAANSYLFEELKAAHDRGVVIVNCTQCSSGVVTHLYAGGIVSDCTVGVCRSHY